MAKISVQDTEIKDGDFFVTDWLRNRNTLEFIGIWEKVHNPGFNYGEFATIRSQAAVSGAGTSTSAPGGRRTLRSRTMKRNRP